MITVNWIGNMAFEATPESGNKFVMDAYPESGGQDKGPTPVEAMLSSIAACSAMDVISILKKKKLNVASYRVEVDGSRNEDGGYPKPYVDLTVRHIIKGDGLDEASVARAVELSDQKYCTIVATLRAAPKVTSVWEIEK